MKNKKTIFAIGVLFVVLISFTSCGVDKKCPAYSKLEKKENKQEKLA